MTNQTIQKEIKATEKPASKTKIHVSVKTNHYEASHKKKPRGRGYWAFGFDNMLTGGTVKDLEPFWYHGSFSEAKKAAIQEAKKRGSSCIIVLS